MFIDRWERPNSIVNEEPGKDRFQPGVDYNFPSKRFPAVLYGRVKEIRPNWGNYGNLVVVESVDPRNQKRVDVLYAHLDKIYVKEGELIDLGRIIGTQGSTGRTSAGGIASIDFLAPAPKGSNSMTPYEDWRGIRQLVTNRVTSGASISRSNYSVPEGYPTPVNLPAPKIPAPALTGAAARIAKLDEMKMATSTPSATSALASLEMPTSTQDWKAAASDPNRPIDPRSKEYWQRADIQMWSQANPELAKRNVERYGGNITWIVQ
jgi:hypothetical protein